jgi:hypothetical protein
MYCTHANESLELIDIFRILLRNIMYEIILILSLLTEGIFMFHSYSCMGFVFYTQVQVFFCLATGP